MLGNSLTESVDRSELLQRNDVANRGIGGDVTEGMIRRLDQVIQLAPKICFIEGGINDLDTGSPVEATASNLKIILKKLVDDGIKVVFTSVLYVTKTYPGFQKLNQKVDSLNALISKFNSEKMCISLI